MRRKLGIKGCVNKFDCGRNPKPENSIFDIKNFPTNKAISFSEDLCDISWIVNSSYVQFKKIMEILRHILKPEQFPCLQYKLHELKPDSPLVMNYNSSTNILVLNSCRDFLEKLESKFINTIVKVDLTIFEEFNISGCMKINMMEHETIKVYELGIIAMRSPSDEILADIKSKFFEFNQSLRENILNCYLKYFYGN